MHNLRGFITRDLEWGVANKTNSMPELKDIPTTLCQMIMSEVDPCSCLIITLYSTGKTMPSTAFLANVTHSESRMLLIRASRHPTPRLLGFAGMVMQRCHPMQPYAGIMSNFFTLS